ncbi:hypothetical protein MBLNU13_g06562t3 [Cladosporium sp. NU13]
MRRLRPRGINSVWAAMIELTYDDRDYQLKLDNLRTMLVNGLPKEQDVTALPDKDGQHRGLFELRTVICESRPDTWSPAFRPEFRDGNKPEKVRILEIFDELIGLAGFDPDQSRFIHVSVDEGVPGNITILQGRPGSGESAILGYLIIILMLFKHKVIATGQANVAQIALLDKVRKIIANHEGQIPELSVLSNRITRLGSPHREHFNMSNLADNLTHHEIEPDCMALRLREYLQTRPREQDVRDFENHMAAQDAGQTYNAPGLNRGLNAVLARLHAKICSTMLLVTSKIFASSAFAQINYFADVALVLLAGDVNQLPRVVKALQARSHPWADILVVPMMKRLQGAQLVRMAARIFYGGRMYCGDHPHGYWENPLELAVFHLLRNARVSPKDHHRIGDRRQIFYAYEGLPVPEVDGTSLTNPAGVACIAQKTRMLLEEGMKPEQVGAITFYKEDKRCIREALATLNIDVEIILIHFVVVNSGEENPYGFVSNPNRLCMATTRAKRFQFMFGNLKFCREWQRKPSSKNKDKRHKEMFQICDWVQEQRQVVEWTRVTAMRAGGRVVVAGAGAGAGNQRRADAQRNGGGIGDIDDDFQ